MFLYFCNFNLPTLIHPCPGQYRRNSPVSTRHANFTAPSATIRGGSHLVQQTTHETRQIGVTSKRARVVRTRQLTTNRESKKKKKENVEQRKKECNHNLFQLKQINHSPLRELARKTPPPLLPRGMRWFFKRPLLPSSLISKSSQPWENRVRARGGSKLGPKIRAQPSQLRSDRL